MAYLLLLLSISLFLPVYAAEERQAKPSQFELNASHNGLYVDPNWATSDDEDKMLPAQLKPLIPGYVKQQPKQDPIQKTSITKVRLPEEVSHGELAVGVLGAYTENYDGTITKILPGSDLLRLGITVGDKIKKIDGKEYSGLNEFRDACRGTPGSTMILTIERQGKTAPYLIKRTDARLFTTDQDGYYKWCVDQIKRW